MTEQGRCGTCRWWRDEAVFSEEDGRHICLLASRCDEHEVDMCKCPPVVSQKARAMVFSEQVTHDVGGPSKPGVIGWHDQALFVTRADFGCVLWEAKETPPTK